MKLILAIYMLFPLSFLPAQGWGGFAPLAGGIPDTSYRIERDPGTSVFRYILKLPAGYYQDRDSSFFRFDVLPPFSAGPLTYPPGTERQGKESYTGEVMLSREVFLPPGSAHPPEISFIVGYQICQEDGVCLLPVEETVTLPWEEAPDGKVPWWTGLDVWILQLAFALLGGLLLNLMPCVFPLLSVKALTLVKSKGLSPGDQRKMAWWYTGGILASLLAVSLVMIGLKAAGEAAGWGFYFQNPGFVLFLTSVLWAFGLSLLGVFVLPASGFGTSGLGNPKGAFFSGLMAVLAAAPCTAPFLGSAMGFAFSQPSGVLIPFFLTAGGGFALPYLLLAHFPGLLKKIPSPGPWMATFEQLMGFLLAGWALVTLSSLEAQITQEAFWHTVTFLFAAALVLWMLGRWARPVDPPLQRRLLWAGALTALVLGGYFTSLGYETTPPEKKTALQESAGFPEDENGWQKFTPEALDQALSQGKRVFVDIWAQWCTNCKINEALVLSRPEVLEALDAAGVLRLKGDLTRPDKVLTDFLGSHGRAGLPFYVYYSPGKDPVILPEILTPGMITELVR